MNKKIALIFGITGQDGSYLAEFLLKKNYVVHGVKRRSSSINTSRIDHIYQEPNQKSRSFFLHYGDITDSTSVSKIIKMIKFRIPNLKVKIDKSFKIKESGLLRLNCKKANQILNWKPYLNTKQSINLTIDWYLDYINKKNIEELTLNQINNYFEKNNFK